MLVGEALAFDFYAREESRLECLITTPSGATFECDISPWSEDSAFGDSSATFTFTPREVGLYLVRARTAADEFFTSTYALEAPGPRLTTLDRPCAWVERFADGAWLCDGVFVREGEPAQPLNVELSSLGGDGVWTFSRGTLGRVLEPRPGQQLALPQAVLDLRLPNARALFGSETDVLVVHSNGILRAAFDGQGQLVETGRVERGIAANAVVRRVGDSVVIAEQLTAFVIGVDPLDPSQAPSKQTEVCVVALRGGQPTERGCRRYDGTLLGELDDGVAIWGQWFELLAVTSELGDGVKLRLPPPLARAVTATPLGVVRFGTGVIVKRVEGALQLQSYEGATGASDRLVWSASPTDTVVLSR